MVVWVFFGIAFLQDWNENWPFPVLWPLLSFANLLAYWVQHFHSIIFQNACLIRHAVLKAIKEFNIMLKICYYMIVCVSLLLYISVYVFNRLYVFVSSNHKITWIDTYRAFNYSIFSQGVWKCFNIMSKRCLMVTKDRILKISLFLLILVLTVKNILSGIQNGSCSIKYCCRIAIISICYWQMLLTWLTLTIPYKKNHWHLPSGSNEIFRFFISMKVLYHYLNYLHEVKVIVKKKALLKFLI